MKIQLDTAQAAIATVLAGVLFDKPEGGQGELAYYLGEIPGKREEEAQGQDIPFCFLQPGPFELSLNGTKTGVVARLALYSAGTRADGLEMVSDVIKKLQGVFSLGHAPCKLLGAISGDPVGIEHPFYSISITLNFKTA